MCFVPRIPADFLIPNVYLTNKDESGGDAEIQCTRLTTPSDFRHVTSFARAALRILSRYFP